MHRILLQLMTKFNMYNSTVRNDIDILLGHYTHEAWQIYYK